MGFTACLMLCDVAGASRCELEDVDENALVRVAGIEGQHPMVDVLLRALALVARSQKSASGIREKAGLEPGRL